jgi:hypothetical protein
MSSDSAIDPDNILTFAAHRSLSQAIDLLWASAADRLQAPNEVSSMATLAIQAADYAKSNPRPPWLKTVGNDREFVEALSEKVTSWQSVGNVSTTEAFGADSDWNPLIAARNRLGQLAQQVSLKNVFDFARRRAVESVGYLIGDIFFYLGQRGTKAEPGVIVKTVIAQLEEAKAAVIDKDKYLIVIAHSLGGEILYDILTYYRPDIQVDLFLTVGSQVGLFEELKLFHSSDPKIPNKAGDKAARPVNIRHWSNVYDLNDLLGFATSKIFTDVADYEFSTGAGLLFSHGSYFTTPSFHERLASRLSEIFR